MTIHTTHTIHTMYIGGTGQTRQQKKKGGGGGDSEIYKIWGQVQEKKKRFLPIVTLTSESS